MDKTFFIPNEESTLKLGESLARVCRENAVIYLYGDLGAGKTTFVRGFLKGLGFAGHVKSPTYTLVESYLFENFSVCHFDFYRIQHPDELQFIGIQDYFSENNIALIEWPEKGEGWLPKADLSCYIVPKNEGREFLFKSFSERGEILCKNFSEN